MTRPVLIIVNDPAELPLQFEGCELVPARAYLSERRYADMNGVRVFNLCRSYRYQSTGYYVSLLAAARGHKPVPSINTIQDFKSQMIVRIETEDLEELIQKSLTSIHSKAFTLSIYFGRNVAKCHDRLSQHLFKLFEAPFLRASFFMNKKNGKWQIQSIGPIAASDIPEEHRDFVLEAAADFFLRKRPLSRKQSGSRYDLAILYNPDEEFPPSNERAIRKFVKAAESLAFDTELIGKEDVGRLAEFDALFIRETTAVMHHTYRFSRRAQAEGIIVIDDPESILKCTNKVFLAELLEKNRVHTPKTIIVHRDNMKSAGSDLGFPCILKRPDSSFSQGVIKVESQEEFLKSSGKMFERSEFIIAQEFLETAFDWRVGVLDRQTLFVCKYYMAKHHWQIMKKDMKAGTIEYGDSDTTSPEDAPPALIRTALRAANLIGDGFYGVDIKEVKGTFYVIEINDNPSVDSGVEDDVLKDELYLKIMRSILTRIERKKQGRLFT